MEAGENYVTAEDCQAMVGRAVSYIKFLMESEARKAELASLASWHRAVGVFMLLFGCLSGAMFTTMLYLTAGPEPSACRSLAFPAVVFAWAFFVSLGTYVYLGWKVRKRRSDNDEFVRKHTVSGEGGDKNGEK